MRVLVTGGAGFLGSTLVDRLLAEDCDVDVIDDLSSGALAHLAGARALRDRRFRFHRLDVCSPQLVDLVVQRRPEVVFHLAAHVDVRESIARPLADAQINVLGTVNVCEAARAAGARKLVYAASGATLYGDSEQVPTRESAVQRPVSPYGVSKKAAGDYLQFYREVHGLEHTSLALANVYGPRQGPDGEAGEVAQWAEHLLAGRVAPMPGDGTATRDYLFVDDAVDALVRAAERGSGLLVNVGTGVETPRRAAYDTLAVMAGARTEPRPVSDVPGAPARSALDPGRAAIHLGWRPWTALDEGLATTLAWFRAQG